MAKAKGDDVQAELLPADDKRAPKEPTQADVDAAIAAANADPPLVRPDEPGPTQEDVDAAVADHNATLASDAVHGTHTITPDDQ